MIEHGLIPWLIADTDIAQYHGGRVFPDRLPQREATPAIVTHLMHDETLDYLSGVDGTGHSTVELDCIADDSAKAKLMARIVKKKLNGYSGSMGQWTVQGAHFTGAHTTTQNPMIASDVAKYIVHLEFSIWYAEF